MNPDTAALINHLKQRYVNNASYTHVSLIYPKGKFYLNRDQEEEFWDLYLESFSTNNTEFNFGIAERPLHAMPIIADLDIKIDEDEVDDYDEHLYTKEQVEFVIKTYQSVIRSVVDNCRDSNLTCVLLEKPIYKVKSGETTYLKNGFHLHFPNCFIDIKDMQIHILPRVREIVEKAEIFESIGFDVEQYKDILDDCCGRNPWLIYGSKKSIELEPYKITKIYNSNFEEITLKELFLSFNLKDTKGNSITIEDNNYEYYIPKLLSINPSHRDQQEIKEGLVNPLKEKIRNKKRREFKEVSTEKALQIARELLPMLSISRSTNRNDWMGIGWILNNISEGSEEGLNLWLEFSQRDLEKYDEDFCIHEWDNMAKGDLGIGTLKYYAKQDDPIAYSDFVKKHSKKHIKDSLDGSHNAIAKLLKTHYGDLFKCASMKGTGEWYEFKEHTFNLIEDAVSIRKILSQEITQLFKDELSIVEEEFKGAEKAEQVKLNFVKKQYQSVIKNLGSAPFKNNIIKEAREVFYDRKFKEKLNADPYIIAFENGVYDLKKNIFRSGRPDDYVSKKMPIDYINFEKSDDRVQEIYDFFLKVFPDNSVRKYFLDVTCECFVGGNFAKIGLLWTGEGDNAKSVTQTFFEKMFGPYAVKLNSAVLTKGKAAGGSANADLARTGDGVRWVVAEELDKDEVINNGLYKHLTGSDSYFARDLFESGKGLREIIPMYLLTIICNKLPRFKDYDIATFNRTRVIPFESTFCRPDNPAPFTWEEQLRQKRFPMDTEFSNKIPKLLPAFAWVLLEHRRNKKHDEIKSPPPPKVLAATEMYKKQNDIYRQFIEESITEDKNSSISLSELYSVFKDWFRESFPSQTLPVKNDIKDYFIRKWGEQDKKKWRGYKIYQDTNSIEEIEDMEDMEDMEGSETKNNTSGSPL